jgi:F-type H+-transporting ATPase subunit gamma
MVAFIFGSDQGLVGQFNDRIINFARRALAGRDHLNHDIVFWVAGAKTADLVEESFGGYEELFSLPSSVDTITTNVQEAVLKLEVRRMEYGETGLTLFYNAPIAGSSYKQEVRPLLPPDEAWLNNLGTGRWPGHSLPFYRTVWPEIFPALIGEYLFVSLFHGYAASMSAENAARLSSMHRAEKNTREMIEDLTFRHNSLRQEKIDEELLEVVSGFEALRSEEQ